MDLSKLKSKSVNVGQLAQAAQQLGGGDSKRPSDDERMWKPTVDKLQNGFAIIRFLPGTEDDDLPWARYWDHGFKGPTGQWLFEKSLTTLGQQCPISEMNQKMWNSGDPSEKAFVSNSKGGSKRRLHYVANILVISDPSAPENEGKVFLYDFGKKIFDKIMDAMQPEFPDEEPINPFDLWSGADFQIKIRKVEGFRNYDKSEFKSPSELFDGDEDKLQAVANQIRPLTEFTDAANFKTYEQLEARLNAVMGVNTKTPRQEADLKKVASAPSPAPVQEAPAPAAEAQPEPLPQVDDEEDTMSYFQKLADEG